MSITKEKIFGSNKIHFIGIGGAGMNGLAEYYLRNGVKISGSDKQESPSTNRLLGLGIEIFFEHSKNNIPLDADIVVYTPAIGDDNEEFLEAKKRGLILIKRAEMLGLTVNDKKLIAVAGTHGKTTTTAMIGKVLIDCGFDPTIFVGGNVEYLSGASTRIGEGEYAVAEADEYDRSFHYLNPDIAVITNIEFDHSDIYLDSEVLMSSFETFVNNLKPGGKVIGFGDDEKVCEVINKSGKEKTLYGFNETFNLHISDYNAVDEFANYKINGKDISLSVLGKHNAANATGAFGALKEVGVSFEKYKESIKTFNGVQRRLELVHSGSFKVWDDYAHHPTEVKAVLTTLKEISKGKVISIFQPHLYSRTRDFYEEFADALTISDEIILLEIYPAREEKIEGVESEMIRKSLSERHERNSVLFNTKEELNSYLLSVVNDSDDIIFMGAGSVTEFCNNFLKQLKGVNT